MPALSAAAHAGMLLAAVGCLGLGLAGADRRGVIRVVLRDALMLLAMLDAEPHVPGILSPLAWATVLVVAALATALASRRRHGSTPEPLQAIGMILMAGLILAAGSHPPVASHAGMQVASTLLVGVTAGAVVFVVATVGTLTRPAREDRTPAHSLRARAHRATTALAVVLMAMTVAI